MKRLLLHQDNAKSQAITGLFSKVKPALDRMKEAYEALNLGDFDINVFKDIKENGATNIRERYETELNKQLDATGVKFPALRKQQFEGSLYPLHDFIEAYNEVPDSVSGEHGSGLYNKVHINYHISYSGYSDEEFTSTTDDSKELILEEHCRVYTENEGEYKIWQAAQKLLKAHHSMRDAIEQAGVERAYISSDRSLILDRIITNIDGELSVKHTLIGNIRGFIAQQNLLKRKGEADAKKYQKQREEREEAHKKAFDISTTEGQAAFEAFHHERALKDEEQRRNVQYLS